MKHGVGSETVEWTDQVEWCPSLETFVDTNGDLYLMAFSGLEQVMVQGPWGVQVHDAVARGGTPDIGLTAEDHDVVERTIAHLGDAGYLRNRARLAAPDLSLHARQVRAFGQFGIDGPEAQRRLRAATVLVAGLGGAGSSAVDALARAGIGCLIGLDDDVVEDVNLARQSLYRAQDLGRRKVDAFVDAATDLGPGIRAIGIDTRIDSPELLERIIREHDVDIVVGAFDLPPVTAKHILDAAAFATGVPVVMGGQRAPFAFVGPLIAPGMTECFACFAHNDDVAKQPDLESRLAAWRDAHPPHFPALGSADAMIGNLMASEVIAWVSQAWQPTTLGRELQFDVTTFQQQWLQPAERRSCTRCGTTRIERDLRELDELRPHAPGSADDEAA